MRKVLVTGAAGRIGKIVVPSLAESWSVRCADLDSETLARLKKSGVETVVCDVSNPEEVRSAVSGCDAVLHLAAITVEASPELITKVNILGTSYVLEACREHAVKRFVYASSNHAVGGYERYASQYPPNVMLDENTPVYPDSYYGASKIYGEALTRWHVARSKGRMTAACLRIGTTGFPDADSLMWNERLWSLWLSDDDLIQITEKALDSTVAFGIYGAVSRNKRRFHSIELAMHDLGYDPQDDAERFAEQRGYVSKSYTFAAWQD